MPGLKKTPPFGPSKPFCPWPGPICTWLRSRNRQGRSWQGFTTVRGWHLLEPPPPLSGSASLLGSHPHPTQAGRRECAASCRGGGSPGMRRGPLPRPAKPEPLGPLPLPVSTGQPAWSFWACSLPEPSARLRTPGCPSPGSQGPALSRPSSIITSPGRSSWIFPPSHPAQPQSATPPPRPPPAVSHNLDFTI